MSLILGRQISYLMHFLQTVSLFISVLFCGNGLHPFDMPPVVNLFFRLIKGLSICWGCYHFRVVSDRIYSLLFLLVYSFMFILLDEWILLIQHNSCKFKYKFKFKIKINFLPLINYSILYIILFMELTKNNLFTVQVINAPIERNF
jgi:hypothetical protein